MDASEIRAGQNWIAISAVIISALALGISVLVWWAEHQKPFSPDGLVRVVRDAMDGH